MRDQAATALETAPPGAGALTVVDRPGAEDEIKRRVRQRTAHLRAMLGRRDVLLREAHHRAKNNLQVIASLIGLQARSLGAGAGREALLECQRRVQAIALVQQALHPSRGDERVPLAEYVCRLAGNVFDALGPARAEISLELDVDDVTVRVDEAIPYGLIVNELLTNALKHAFPEGRRGAVRVELRAVEQGALRLGVCDDGVGLPAGFDVERAGSLGLQLVGLLARQLGARLEVDATGGGTRIELVLPGDIA